MVQRHPKGLYYLFLTEMWERFSFYGISAILVLYLTKQLGIADKEANLASGAFVAFTFMTPIVGGYVADQVLGLRRSVALGGLLILAGNLALALLEGVAGVFLGLSLVALGTGYLKATVSVMVGRLYGETDTHRDAGYTLFYMGINIGALLAGVFVAWVADAYGWTKGFYLSSAGMAFGLVVFWLGTPHYNNTNDGYRPGKLWSTRLGVPVVIWITAGTVALGALMIYFFHHSDHTKMAITYLSIAIIAGLTVLAVLCTDRKERDSIFAIIIIIVAAVCFQSYFKQMYNSLQLFVDRDIDRAMFAGLSHSPLVLGLPAKVGVVLSKPLPPSFFALVPNSLSVILFAGLFTYLWARLADKGRNPSIPMKIVIALCLAVASAALLAWVSHRVAVTGVRASAWWVVLSIAILTLGELNILPMGLSAVSTLAPRRYSSLLMGSWFLCSSIGGYFSGFLASLASVDKEKSADITYTATAYFALYWRCAALLAFVALVMLVITPFVKRLMAAR